MKTRIILLTLIVATMTACISGSYLKRISEAKTEFYTTNDPLAASRKLIGYVNSGSKEQLLYMMEAGYLLQKGGNLEKSNQILMAADKMIDNQGESVTQNIGTYLLNETGKDYKGEDYERVLVNMHTGMNFLLLEKYDEALVEFKKVNYKLDKIRQESGINYKQNLLAKYLAAVSAYYAEELDYAYVELKQIEKIQPGLPPVVHGLMMVTQEMKDLDDYAFWAGRYPYIRSNAAFTGKNFKKAGEVVFVFEAGKAPIKESRGKLLDEPGMKEALLGTARASSSLAGVDGALIAPTLMLLAATTEHPIPKYEKQEYYITNANLILTDKQGKTFNVKPVNMVDIENTMVNNFEENYSKVKNKMIVRLGTKLAAAIATKISVETAMKNSARNDKERLIAMAAGWVAGGIVGFAGFQAEEPDLRSWNTLPAFYNASSILLPEGEYTGVIQFLDSAGNVVREKQLEKPVVVANYKPVIVTERTTD